MPTKSSTPSLPSISTVYHLALRLVCCVAIVVGVLVAHAWYQVLARIEAMFLGSASPDVSTASSSPNNLLPLEIIDMILIYFADDIRSLQACSLTSRSWNVAALPRLHHTLSIQSFHADEEYEWPKPLRMASKFGLLPLYTKLSIAGRYRHGDMFTAKEFNRQTKRDFSSLTNVRELSIRGLDIPTFLPRIQSYFGQLSALTSLTLTSGYGSGRQVVFFIGLFPRLEDVELRYQSAGPQRNTEDGLTLVPSFVPPLRGRLKVLHPKDGIGEAMFDMFGELRFHHMDFQGGRIQHLLYACPNALETLKLDVADICGEWPPPRDIQPRADYFADKSYRGLDLSRNKSLRKLEFTAESLFWALRYRVLVTIASSLEALLSTVKSPTFSDVVVVYHQGDFYDDEFQHGIWGSGRWRGHFEVFRAMYRARDYRLVLSMRWVDGRTVRLLEWVVARERAKGGLPPQIEISRAPEPC